MPTNNTPTAYNRYQNSLADSRTGNPIPSVSVYVFDGGTAPVALQAAGDAYVEATNGALATLRTSETDATEVAQPLTTAADGSFALYAPYGRYDLVFVRRGKVLQVWPQVYVTGVNAIANAAMVLVDPAVGGLGTVAEVLGAHESVLGAGGSNIVHRVDSLTDLQNTEGSVGRSVVQLLGYYAAGDGGGGKVYEWHDGAAAGTYVDNGADTIVPGDGSSAWIWTSPESNLFQRGIPKSTSLIADKKTAEVVAMLDSLPEDFDGVIDCPHGVAFDVFEVLPHIPPAAALSLTGAQVGYISSTYRIKKQGIATSDLENNDSGYSVISGHHAQLKLHNARSSGSTSADKGYGTISWAVSSPSHGAEGRNNAMLQFGKDTATDTWHLSLRPYTPWAAIANGYTTWATGTAYETGDVVLYGSRFYTASTTGTSGATAPTHAIGTASDGGVSWTNILNADSTRWLLTENGRMGIGGGAATNESLTITAPLEGGPLSAIMSLRAQAGGSAAILAQPKNSGGTLVPVPSIYFRNNGFAGFEGTGGVRTISGDMEGAFWGSKKHYDFTVSGETPSVGGKATLKFNSADPVTVTDFVDEITNQEIVVFNTGAGEVTLTGANFKLTGSAASVVLTQFSAITLRRITVASGSWVEISRSIK